MYPDRMRYLQNSVSEKDPRKVFSRLFFLTKVGMITDKAAKIEFGPLQSTALQEIQFSPVSTVTVLANSNPILRNSGDPFDLILSVPFLK